MKVLVVVDMQNDFITGPLGTPESINIVQNVKQKVEDAVRNGDLIIYTRDTHFSNYLTSKEGIRLPVEHCIQGSDGWRIPDELLPPADYDSFKIFNKYTFGFDQLAQTIAARLVYENKLLECTEIELVGLCTDICVVSNALLLKSRFYNSIDVSVDASCCAGVTPGTHEAALKTMEMCQINIKNWYNKENPYE